MADDAVKGAKAADLAPELRAKLLEYLGDRLSTGEVLVMPEQFAKATEEGFIALTGEAVTDQIRQELARFVAAANAEDPTQLLAPGFENWVSLSVLASVRKAGFGITEVQEQGTQLIRDLMRTDPARALLEQLGLKAQLINMSKCHRFVANRIAGRQDDGQKNASARLAAAAAERLAEAERLALTLDPSVGAEERIEALLEGPVSIPDEAEVEARRTSEKAARVRLRQEQMGDLVANLDNYISLGRITQEDADRLRKAHQVDQAVRSGKIDGEKGSKIRNSILSGQARDRIERHTKEALDYAVAYLQVFEALGRIDPRFDPALRFLVCHGDPINEDATESGAPAGLGPVVEALMLEPDVLRLLIDMMDRKEAEVRMIAARLPPYSLIVKRDQGRLQRVAVDEDFITQLREMSVEDLSSLLHSGDRKQRARPAAAMMSLTVLINRLIKPTPIRKELRMLKMNLIIEEFYHATNDVEQARQRAQEFLNFRLKTLYPDLSREETEELQRRGEEIVQRVEEKVLAERGARKNDRPDADGGETEETLSEDERRLGVQIQRVSVRIAGRIRQIRYRIMPDPEDAEKFFICRKDPDSDEIVPVLRRGVPRYVQRVRGTWELA